MVDGWWMDEDGWWIDGGWIGIKKCMADGLKNN